MSDKQEPEAPKEEPTVPTAEAAPTPAAAPAVDYAAKYEHERKWRVGLTAAVAVLAVALMINCAFAFGHHNDDRAPFKPGNMRQFKFGNPGGPGGGFGGGRGFRRGFGRQVPGGPTAPTAPTTAAPQKA